MPRKQFLADLKDIQLAPLPEGIHSLRAGDDDGQFEFTYQSSIPGHTVLSLQITAIVADVSAYPTSHEYMIFCGDDAPPQLASRLQNIRGINRKTISQLVELVANELGRVVVQNGGITQPTDIGLEDAEEVEKDGDNDDNDSDDYDLYDQDDETFLTGAPTSIRSLNMPDVAAVGKSTGPTLSTTGEFKERLRADLRAVKKAGFRVGVIGNIFNGLNAFVSVSIRISKLGISDEAMLAWQVKPEEYLMLLIYYPSGYKTNEQLQAMSGVALKTSCTMRVFSSKTYKPSREQAITAFQKVVSTGAVADDQPKPTAAAETCSEPSSNLRTTFLSTPLARLLDDELFSIIRFRAMGMDWAGAEAWFRDRESSRLCHEDIPDRYYGSEHTMGAFPAIVTGDQYANRDLRYHSFPLVAMQFMLRHFVRCVEFCLVCNRKTDSDLEAIKPYVCERPLCLFQYMAMGFGPSIEHEILSQPYVVDLLISFCYYAACSHALTPKDLPTGLGIKVPIIRVSSEKLSHRGLHDFPPPVPIPPPPYHKSSSRATLEGEEFGVSFDRVNQQIRFLDRPDGGCPVVRGSWIVLQSTAENANTEVLHCRVTRTNFFPVITVDKPIIVSAVPGLVSSLPPSAALHTPPEEPIQPSSPQMWTPCTLRRYDQDFDSLDEVQKCDVICQLLNVLPSVKDMQAFLHRSSVQDLKRWNDRIPQSALQILQWIIASNRACIMQVDDCVPGSTTEEKDSQPKKDRLYGMDRYMQFRFAMGAPDKEERFLSEVKKTRRRLKLEYPTIFAWHGSPLHNWHMIIREGLHFEKQSHGRAYGHGVYHAKDARTSISYSGRGASTVWPNSELKISAAIALNELVNAPAEFISTSPYYVVAQLDWIQTRYLLVQCNTSGLPHVSNSSKEQKPKNPHPQDPSRTPDGLNGAIIIPASAIKSGARKNHKDEEHGRPSSSKRLKGNSGDPIIIDLDSDLESLPSDEEDLAVLRVDTLDSDQATAGATRNGSVVSKCAKIVLGEEDFVPGLLEYTTLPLMPVPTYASQATTKRLMNELKSLQKLLDTTSQRDLGWYIDTSRVDNVYQWIVELHSFHTFEVKGKRLPMADDMKNQKIKSVVLEIRFGADFPFSPPYVRVVRPRFLSLMQGGGGHIVMGGAMCMELLTNTGWSGISSMESVLMQVRLAMASEPFARLDQHARSDYGAGEAADGYIRACRTHGWTVPPGFQEIAYGMSSTAEKIDK